MLHLSILLCSLKPENTWPPLILSCSHSPPSAHPKHASYCNSLSVWQIVACTVSLGGLCDTGSGRKSCRQTKPKGRNVWSVECVLTADCTTQDSVGYSGRIWWSDSWNTHTGRDTLRISGNLKTKYPGADAGNKKSPHDLNFHKLQ